MLFVDAMESTFIMDKVTQPDGRGGVITTYVEGAEISAAYSFDTSTEARVAEAAGTKNRFTITTDKKINLAYHTVIKRAKDGQIFRITSDGSDNATPAISSLDIRQVEAEKWELPANG